MTIDERVELYKKIFRECKAKPIVIDFIQPVDKIEALEAIRLLNMRLSEAYNVSLPVVTVWVRDNSYVAETEEIYLTEPTMEDFLHQFRHHLQNMERRYDRRGLTVEGQLEFSRVPYKDCIYYLRGEDDAIAWSKYLIHMARLCNQ